VTGGGLLATDWAAIVGVLENQKHLDRAILFGSRAKGTQKRGSDVDLALAGSQVDHSLVVDVSMELNEETLLPYHFDVLNYNTVTNQALREHIDRVGLVVYERKGGRSQMVKDIVTELKKSGSGLLD